MFLDHKGNTSTKWTHYFPIYEAHLQRFVNQSVTLLEIGVLGGGSLQLWKKYLGPLAVIVGIDIVADYAKYAEEDCHIRIGSQSDVSFISTVINEFGVPDIVIDDGSHMQRDINATFSFLFPQLPNNSVYIVEDLHTAYFTKYGGGGGDSFIEKSKSLVDKMHEWYTGNDVDYMCRNLWSICFYDSITVFEKKKRLKPRAIESGLYK